MALVEESSQDLLQAYVELWHQSLCYTKSMALAVALDLRIPDAIHHHGGSATLPQILAETALHPNKLRALRSLMRALTVFGTFSVQQPPTSGDDPTVDASGEAVYRLTAASRFLVSDEVSSATLASFLSLALHPIAVAPHTLGMCAWFRQEQNEPSPYALAFRQTTPTIWQHADDVNALLHKGMVQDSRFLMPIVLRECGEVFRGIDSLVDVAGGHGGATAIIAAAFPHLKCSVLDLPHVVAGAPSDGNVQFVAGNMFESIPPATAVFLKVHPSLLTAPSIFHCICILRSMSNFKFDSFFLSCMRCSLHHLK